MLPSGHRKLWPRPTSGSKFEENRCCFRVGGLSTFEPMEKKSPGTGDIPVHPQAPGYSHLFWVRSGRAPGFSIDCIQKAELESEPAVTSQGKLSPGDHTVL